MSKMRKFSVPVRVEIERAVMVDAESASEAEELAMEVVTLEYGSDTLMFPQDATAAPESVRTETYVCHHCGRPSPKGAWGPGHIRCPHCKRVAPTAEDLQEETFGLALLPG